MASPTGLPLSRSSVRITGQGLCALTDRLDVSANKVTRLKEVSPPLPKELMYRVFSFLPFDEIKKLFEAEAQLPPLLISLRPVAGYIQSLYNSVKSCPYILASEFVDFDPSVNPTRALCLIKDTLFSRTIFHISNHRLLYSSFQQIQANTPLSTLLYLAQTVQVLASKNFEHWELEPHELGDFLETAQSENRINLLASLIRNNIPISTDQLAAALNHIAAIGDIETIKAAENHPAYPRLTATHVYEMSQKSIDNGFFNIFDYLVKHEAFKQFNPGQLFSLITGFLLIEDLPRISILQNHPHFTQLGSEYTYSLIKACIISNKKKGMSTITNHENFKQLTNQKIVSISIDIILCEKERCDFEIIRNHPNFNQITVEQTIDITIHAIAKNQDQGFEFARTLSTFKQIPRDQIAKLLATCILFKSPSSYFDSLKQCEAFSELTSRQLDMLVMHIREANYSEALIHFQNHPNFKA